MISLVKKQKKFGTVPDDKVFLVEDEQNIVIIHTCSGTLVNETLGRFLTSLLTARMGSVGLKTDPYRIILTFQQKNIDFFKRNFVRHKTGISANIPGSGTHPQQSV